MSRTLNPVAHAVRRDAFVDAAQRLIASKGYEDLSIQDVIDDVGASKGAFYHYFDSKQALLGAVVERITDQAAAALEPIVADDATAIEKLERLFRGLAQWKGARTDLMIELIRIWLSDENSVVREHMRQSIRPHIQPLLGSIVRQGVDEGTFCTTWPDETADVIVSILQGLNERATNLFFDRHAGLVSFEEVHRIFDAYAEALDRILGLPSGTLKLGDEPTIERWFGDTEPSKGQP